MRRATKGFVKNPAPLNATPVQHFAGPKVVGAKSKSAPTDPSPTAKRWYEISQQFLQKAKSPYEALKSQLQVRSLFHLDIVRVLIWDAVNRSCWI
jgi:hypothetical protein